LLINDFNLFLSVFPNKYIKYISPKLNKTIVIL
jgi:hypothetical protein